MGKNNKFAGIEDVINWVGGMSRYPLEITRQVNEQYRLLERQVNELARASGMSDQTYDSIVANLTQKAAGTQIQVLQMMKMVFETLGNTINFQDPVNVNAIFGSMDKVNENIGPKGLRAWLKDQLLPTIQKTRDLGLNPKQVTNLISNAANSSIGAQRNIRYLNPDTKTEVPFTNIVMTQDGRAIDRETGKQLIEQSTLVDPGQTQADIRNLGQAALVQGSQDWQEMLGWKGSKLRDVMDYTQGARRALTPITMRPDDQQRVQALTERELTALDQRKLNLLLALEKGLAPSALLGVEGAQQLLDWAAHLTPTAVELLGPAAQLGTLLTETTTSPGGYLIDPQKALQEAGLGKAASEKSKFIKISKINDKFTKISQIAPTQGYVGSTYTYPESSYQTNEKEDPFTPQPQSGTTAWQQDVFQTDISMEAATQARVLEYARVLGQRLTGAIMTSEKEANMLSQHIQQFEAGLGSMDSLSMQGVTDETIVANMKPLMLQLIDKYAQLLQLYNMAESQFKATMQSTLKGSDKESIPGILAKSEGFYADLKSNEQEVIYKQKRLIIDAQTIEQRMKQKLQEAVVSDTLKETSKLYEDVFGSSIARGELAASQATEAKHLLDAAQAAGAAGTGMSPVTQARLRQKALGKLTESLGNLSGSTKSPVSGTSDRLTMLGI